MGADDLAGRGRRGSLLVQVPDTATFALDGDLVLYRDGATNVYVLNTVGAAIWEYCARPRTVLAIATTVATTFAISTDRALADSGPFVEALLDAELLAAQPQPAGE